MALTQGTVTIASNGTVTKAGEAGTLYDLLVARANTKLAAAGQPQLTTGTGNKEVKQGLADLANDLTAWLVPLLTSRAKVEITTSDSGLQRMPASTTEDTPTKAPAAQKLLSII